MKKQPRPKPPRVAPPTPGIHPVDVPRNPTGSKGDAWVMALPELAPEPGEAVLAFDTGRDSVTIVIGGVEGAAVRRHPTHDLALVLPVGSGVLRHGAAPDALTDERYEGPCTLVVPAGTWHAIVPDAEAPAGVAFLTRPGTTIDPFSIVGPRAEPGLVHLDTLPVSPWPMTPAALGPAADAAAAARAAVAAERTAVPGAATAQAPSPVAPSRPARVVPYALPEGESYSLPLDTGTDTLFVMTSRNHSWDRAPVDVAVHRHDREDEFIVLGAAAEGWLLNGGTQESVQRVPFRGPCVLVMPSGNFHRVVRTDDAVVGSILVYSHRSQVTGTWASIVAEMELGEDAA
ncbi:MAG: hypothetical protein U0869_00810 [Chloroflexota bacterium]